MNSRERIAEALASTDGFVSGAALACCLGISRTAVWKHVAALRRAGYEIESLRARGYRLVTKPETLTAKTISLYLDGSRMGSRLVALESTTSTNDDATELARKGFPEGTVVVAEVQTAGRGRLGRQWVSPAGVNLMMSCVLRPAVPPAVAPRLSLVVALAVVRTLEIVGLSASIKWPNDVVVEGRKVCGILTEIEAEADRVRFVIVGIGLNVNSTREHFPADLRDRATSIRLESGRVIDRARLLGRLLSTFETYYDRFLGGSFSELAAEWNRCSAMNGRQIHVQGPGEVVSGRCLGIDDEGALLVARRDGVCRVIAGDVMTVDRGMIDE